jgi:hypothetical protein
MHLLLDHISGEHGPRPTLPVEAELVVRASAGPPGGRRQPR